MIETDRLVLTPMGLEDAGFVLEILNTKEWIENIGQRNVSTLAQAEEYIKDKMIDHYTKHGYGNYLMTTKVSNAKIGCVSLYNREDVEGVDIGFALLPKYFRLGYAFEGASAIKDYANEQLGIRQICAFTSKENVASQGLILKLGLVYDKVILFGDQQEELLYYTSEAESTPKFDDPAS